MTEPKIEELRLKANSKFALVMGAAKRTRQIIDFMNALGRGDAVSENTLPPDMNDIVDRKPVMIALKEIGNDRIKIIYPSGQDEEAEESKKSLAAVEGELESLASIEEQTEAEIKETALQIASKKESKPKIEIPEILKTSKDKEEGVEENKEAKKVEEALEVLKVKSKKPSKSKDGEKEKKTEKTKATAKAKELVKATKKTKTTKKTSK